MLKPAGSPDHEERRNAIITHAMNTLEKDHGIYLARKVGAGTVDSCLKCLGERLLWELFRWDVYSRRLPTFSPS